MLRVFFTLGIFFLGSSADAAPGKVVYDFQWEQTNTNLEFKMFLAPNRMSSKVGKQGEYKEGLDLPIEKPLADNKLELAPSERAVLYLVAKNPSKKAVKFYVAPHHIMPTEASLGFNFRCLCYNHIYEVKPGGLWYRVMLLKTDSSATPGTVTLKHKIIKKN